MATIPSLYNTGSGFSVDTQDTHYALSVIQGNSTVGSYAYVCNDSELGTWLANDATSRWLAPLQNAGTRFDGTGIGSTIDGIYRYRISFDLTGYNPNSASITLRVATDNDVEINLNGRQVAAYEANSPAFNYNNWRAVGPITSGFSSGVNVIDFNVKNWLVSGSGSATGLRVEFTSATVDTGQANALMFSCNS